MFGRATKVPSVERTIESGQVKAVVTFGPDVSNEERMETCCDVQEWLERDEPTTLSLRNATLTVYGLHQSIGFSYEETIDDHRVTLIAPTLADLLALKDAI